MDDQRIAEIKQRLEAAPTGHGRRVNDGISLADTVRGGGGVGCFCDLQSGTQNGTEDRGKAVAAREGRGGRVFGMVMDDQRIAEIRARLGGRVKMLNYAEMSRALSAEERSYKLFLIDAEDLLAEVERLRGTLDTVRGDSNMLQALMEAHGDHILQLTEALEEHPDGYDGPCQCETCRSYGD